MIYIRLFETTLRILGLIVPEPYFYDIYLYCIDEDFYN